MSNHLVLGTRKGLIQLEYNGRAWSMCRESLKAVPVSYAFQDKRDGTFWAACDHGHWGTKLRRSRDGGATWAEVAAPRYPDDAMLKEGTPATASYLWYIAPGGNDQPQRLYVGTEPGGVFQSDDGGDSFHLIEGLWNVPERMENWFGGGRDFPGSCSIVVDPRDSDHILVGISVGGVYETHDGGKSWQARNKGLIAEYLPDPHAEFGHDPHFMTAAPSNPDVLWQQNHCGIFRSTDSAKTWTRVSDPETGPAHFGFAIAVDAQDENVAWVVPAISDEYRMAIERTLYVCRTEDGGKTWQTLRNGLPQTNAYDVTFRHALDISGDRLAFGTTTGNVYVSDDRGDSWTCVGNNFAPIYSVRFTN